MHLLHPATTNEDLLQLMLTGDETALETLYARLHPVIYRFAFRLGGSAALADDVSQETFLQLIQEGARFDPSRGNATAYLLGIARHVLWNRLDRDQKFVPLAETSDESDLSPTTSIDPTTPLTSVLQHETVENVRLAITGLPAHYRDVVVLCDLQELSYQDVATILGCPIGTVRSRLHRAHDVLCQRLFQFRNASLNVSVQLHPAERNHRCA